MAVSLSITISQGSQNIANNQTVVSVTAYAKSTNGSYNNNSKSGTIVIDGTSYSFTSSFKKNTTTTLSTKSKTVTHNADGTRTVSASASYATGVSSGTIRASGSKTLTTIPRASDVTCPTTFSAATAGAITLSRKSTAFVHKASCSLGSTGLSATSGIATSFTYTPPESLFDSADYANVKSRSGSISVQTVNSSGTNIGSAVTKSFTVNLPENSTSKPICTLNSDITEVDTSYAERYGVLIAGKSKLKFTCTSSAKLSATIAQHYFTVPGSSATKGADNTVTTGILTTSSSNATFSYYVKDSRGFTSETKTITNPYKVVEYKNPNIIGMTAIRCNENGIEDPVNGTKVKFKIDYYVDPIALSDSDKSPNTATIKVYQLAIDDDGNITSRTVLKDANGADLTVTSSGTYTALAATEFPTTNSFYYEATIVDELSTVEPGLGNGVRSSVNTAKALLSFYGGDGLAMGKIAEKEGLDIAFDTSIKGVDFTIEESEYDGLLNSLGDSSIEITPLTLVNIVHPVGSVIANADTDFDPNVHFGGTTWERYAEGRMLIGLDTGDAAFQTVGSEGGEKTHTLTTAEMPTHKHMVHDYGNTEAVYSSNKSLNSSSSTSAPTYATRLTKTGSGYTKASETDTYRLEVTNTGSSNPHNNLPPYKVVNYWIRIA